MADERRRYERIAIQLPVRLYIPGAAGALRFEAFATSLDLGLGGLFVQSSFLLRAGVELWVELRLPSGPLPVPALVSYVVGHDAGQGPAGMGLEFQALDPASRETLLRFFAPDRYRAFFAGMVKDFPHLERELPLDAVALVLNLWEEWKIMGGAEAPAPAPAAPAAHGHRRGARK